MALPYTPDSEHGRGFFPILARIIQFVTLVIGAIGYEWPLTVEQARANLQRVAERAQTLQPWLDSFSTDARKHYDDWLGQANALTEVLRTAENADNTAVLNDALKKDLKAFINQTWAFMSILDQELLGLTADQTDPGNAP